MTSHNNYEYIDNHTQNNYKQIEVECPARESGCLWMGHRDQLNNHLDACLFQQMKPAFEKVYNVIESQRIYIKEVEERVEQQRILFEKQMDQQKIGLQKEIRKIKEQIEWKPQGITIAGGNRNGNQLNQLSGPQGIFIDDEKNIYIADSYNNRIVQWKYGKNKGQAIAGENGKGNINDQLHGPTELIVDKQNNSLIIADNGNRRVMRWSSENKTNQQILISDIDCYGLTMDKYGFIYVCDSWKNEVRRWKEGEAKGTIVAGGNGKGDHLNQLNYPTFLFADEDCSLYVSDRNNNRVMKWRTGAKEGIVVAGGNGQGNSLTQLYHPHGVIVDHLGQIYVADYYNHRVMRWCEGSSEGVIVVDGNGKGRESYQLNHPTGLSFDVEGNLYVSDMGNHRIQKFEVDFADISPRAAEVGGVHPPINENFEILNYENRQ